MPRILDIGAFNAVRESGLRKLLPNVPRITVGMGTCGRGNGAEEVFHALKEGIDRGGLDVQLASVGCFGPCFLEPLVNVRLPGNPLVVLSRVQANDANRILEAVSNGEMPADLILVQDRGVGPHHRKRALRTRLSGDDAVERNPVFQRTEKDCVAQLRPHQPL